MPFVSRCVLLCLTALSVLGCDPKPVANSNLLIGRWELMQGYRNQKPTETLRGTFFEFESDGRMRTNLPVGSGESRESRYELTGKELRQKSGDSAVAYKVEQLTDSVLTLLLEMRGVQFELQMRRAMPEEVLPAVDTLE